MLDVVGLAAPPLDAEHLDAALLQDELREMAADEPGDAGDQHFHVPAPHDRLCPVTIKSANSPIIPIRTATRMMMTSSSCSEWLRTRSIDERMSPTANSPQDTGRKIFSGLKYVTIRTT